MLPGVYPAKRKDGTPYFRAGIHYKNKQISLGSYTEESLAHTAYSQADSLLHDSGISLETDLRYSNVILLNSYHGVIRHVQNGMVRFKARIHINGNYIIGSYSTSVKAAVAYNKAVDLAKRHGIAKNFPENYVEELSAKEYAELYTKIKISKKFLAYLDSMSSISD